MNATLSFANPGVARYAQLVTLFRSRIESGEWAVGQRIPTLSSLVTRFGLARTTVRQALSALAADGLLARNRAKGTFVLKQPAAPRGVPLAITWDALTKAHGKASIRQIEARDNAMPPAAMTASERLALAYRFFKRLHRVDGIPHLIGNVYLDTRICDTVSSKELRKLPMLRLMKMQNVLPVKSARQTITLGVADLEAASLLQVRLNSPVALVDRFMLDKEATLVYYSRGVYRGDQLRLDITLK